MLSMECLSLNGVDTIYLPISEMIPITKYDYWCKSWKFWTKQNPIIDLDMIYANKTTKEMYVFEKDGTWHDEGVNHDELSMDKTYNEHHWYDLWNPQRM